eukprot:s876_g5.t1
MVPFLYSLACLPACVSLRMVTTLVILLLIGIFDTETGYMNSTGLTLPWGFSRPAMQDALQVFALTLDLARFDLLVAGSHNGSKYDQGPQVSVFAPTSGQDRHQQPVW